MRAISLWQPHGSLLVTGAKPFETRHWKTHVRGTILLHAAQRCVKWELDELLARKDYVMGLAPLLGLPLDFTRPPNFTGRANGCLAKAIPFGCLIGVGDLVNCIRVEDMTPEQEERARDFGDFSPGRFAWEFRNVFRFKTPVPAKGHQGFFYSCFDPAMTELIPVTPGATYNPTYLWRPS